MKPDYTVLPPPHGRHICFERNERVWVAFLNGERVAEGATVEAAREGLDRHEMARIRAAATQIVRLPCGRYQLRVCGKAAGIFNTRREAREATL